MAAPCSRSRRDDGKWQVVPDSQIHPPHHRRHADGDHRPGRRPRPHEDHGRSDRPPRARHAQQLRRRHHALGHLADLRGELQRLLLGQGRRRPSRGRELQALRRARQLVRLGQVPRPLRRHQGAERGEPLRLDRRDRPVRSRPRRRRSAPRSAASSTRAPTGIVNKDGRYVVYQGDDERFDYVYKFVTDGTRRSAPTAPPTATCSTTARSPSRATTPTARGDWLPLVLRPGPADRGERLRTARPTC